VLFAGYPRAINAFFSLGKPHLRERVNSGSIALRRRRGVLLCRRIYGGSYRALLENMSRLHPALTEGMLEEGYGRILSRPGLTPRERELLIIPVLAGLDAWRQIPPHLRGAVRVGATVAELRRVLEGVRDLLGRRTDRVFRMLEAGSF